MLIKLFSELNTSSSQEPYFANRIKNIQTIHNLFTRFGRNCNIIPPQFKKSKCYIMPHFYTNLLTWGIIYHWTQEIPSIWVCLKICFGLFYRTTWRFSVCVCMHLFVYIFGIWVFMCSASTHVRTITVDIWTWARIHMWILT